MFKAIEQYLKANPDHIFMALIFLFAAVLNLQFLDCSNVNYAMTGHDEYIAVREVYGILHPISVKHFIMAIISGDVLYYGRIMFYTDALFAYLPYKAFGLGGMVYTIRMVHTFLVISGLTILGNTFLKDWKYRLIFFIGITTLYYSTYFYMVPKPDPLQLLTLSLFFYYFKKNNYSFGRYFILLGIAYGIKFNILTLLPLAFVLPFLIKGKSLIQNLKPLVTAIIFFLSGLLLAVPCLLLSPFKPIFIKSYFNSTFGYAEQYDDDLNLTIWDWVSKGWFGAYNGGTVFGIALLVLVMVILYFGIAKFFKSGKAANELIILLSGLFLLIPVLILTKRIWPHYLWTGYILIFLGIIMFLQQEGLNKVLRIACSLTLIFIFFGSFKCSFAQGKGLFSLEKESKPLLDDGKGAYAYLKAKDKEFKAVQDLTVPYPFEEMVVSKPYHPFATVLKDSLHQKFVWTSFIKPEILYEENADYLLIYKNDFEDSVMNIRTAKDSTVIHNNLLMRKELGKTIFFDTSFGQIKIYRINPSAIRSN